MGIKKEVKKAGEGLMLLTPCEKLLNRSGFLLNKAAQKVKDDYETVLRPTGLSAKHAGVLMNLNEKGLISQHELGQCSYIDRTTVVGLIDDLEKLGLVERKEHLQDRRSHLINLTPKGKNLLPTLDKYAAEIERKFLNCLSTLEQKNLIQILQKLFLSHFQAPKESR